jgi:hypothetical protein
MHGLRSTKLLAGNLLLLNKFEYNPRGDKWGANCIFPAISIIKCERTYIKDKSYGV